MNMSTIGGDIGSSPRRLLDRARLTAEGATRRIGAEGPVSPPRAS